MTIKTMTTVDGINVADFGNTVNKYYWFKNLGDSTIYVSNKEDFKAGDNGNIIPDAVTNSDDDAFADYLSHISFGADGGSVTSHGLDGDTEFKFEVYVKKVIYTDGSVAYVTSVKLTTRNLVTGQEYVHTTNGCSSLAGKPAHRVKITDVSVSSSAVDIKFDFINGSTGAVINSSSVQATVGSVDGTSFRGEKDWGSSVTQNSEPSETIDYS